MTDKEALKMALDALESCTPLDTSSSYVIYPWHDEKLVDKAISVLKERLLADPMYEVQRLGQEIEQEPVAWADHGVVNWIADKQFMHEAELYTHPPQRTWVGLTDDEIWDTYMESPAEFNCHTDDLNAFCAAIEAKLKDKNSV